MVAVTETLADLRRLVDDGKIADVCRHYDVQLLVLFGRVTVYGSPRDKRGSAGYLQNPVFGPNATVPNG